MVRSSQDVPVAIGSITRRANAQTRYVLVITTPYTLELIEYTIVLVQIAQLATQVVVHGDCVDRLAVHVNVPNAKIQIVA